MSAESVATTPRSKSGNRGVYESSYGGKWFAQIRRGGKLHYLGTFGSPEDAAEAYSRAAELFDAR